MLKSKETVVLLVLCVATLLCGHYYNKAELAEQRATLAEKYNTKLKTDYTKFWNQKSKEADERYEEIQSYLLEIQTNNIQRIDSHELRIRQLETNRKGNK